VPAVAVIQGRQVLFIFIRFKGYLDGILFFMKIHITRVLIREANISTISGEMKFFDTSGTGKGKNNPLCIN
jgi:hypothetical protein